MRGVRVIARTDEFDTAEAERIAVLFGRRPEGVACPLAHFACPFGNKHIAVVRVEDRPGAALCSPFRILVLARELYRHSGRSVRDLGPLPCLTGTRRARCRASPGLPNRSPNERWNNSIPC